jgi:hypothetical protein
MGGQWHRRSRHLFGPGTFRGRHRAYTAGAKGGVCQLSMAFPQSELQIAEHDTTIVPEAWQNAELADAHLVATLSISEPGWSLTVPLHFEQGNVGIAGD